MKEFGKRLSWRLTGGIVTIALGALAAAQAQRQGLVDESLAEVPRLHAPAWSSELPVPIQPHEDLRPAQQFTSTFEPDNLFGSDDSFNEPPAPVMQAAFSPPSSFQPDQDSYAQAGYDSPQDNFGSSDDAAQPVMIAQVDHEGPSMGLPAMGLPDAVNPQGQGPQGSPADGPATLAMPMGLPAMDMPAMGMPNAGMQNAGMPNPVEQAGPQVMAPPTAEQFSPPSNPMPELVMDQGPGFPGGPDQMMGANQPTGPAPLGMAQNTNALRAQPSAVEIVPPQGNALRSVQGLYGSMAQEPAAPPVSQFESQPVRMQPGSMDSMAGQTLPRLPQNSQPPQTLPAYEDNRGYAAENYPSASQVPSRLAGHQRNLPGGFNDPVSLNNSAQSDNYTNSSPGDRRLEGVQSPSVVIHKRAPAEVKVGKPATFIIHVRNVGSAEALGVQVHDRIPAGMQLIDATPQPQLQGDALLWQIGAMPAGDERSITMQLVPMEEGELGSVARVTFEAAASVRTRSTRPELKITQKAPQKVLIGQQLEIELEVANIGTGEATNVILQEDVPDGLDHARGRQLDNSMGSLRPGEVRREILRLRAAKPGMVQNTVRLISEDSETATHTVNVEVVAPSLNVGLTGPSRRYLEREATYNVNIENNGTAPATNVELIAYLDRGFTFISTENNGHYDQNRHAVLWSIVNLPAGELGSVPVTLLPVEEGDQAIRLEAVADLDTRSQSESTVSVQSQAELTFSIADTADPIELGSETTYEIRVNNAGSRNDTNIQLRVQLPPGLELLESDSDAGSDGRGGVIFAPHAQMAAGGDLTYRLRVRGVQPDTHVIQAILTSDQSRVPVTKEESTMVYADQ